MKTRTELDDTLIALIPEDGSRISNAEIKAALEKEAGDSISEVELMELKTCVMPWHASNQEARGNGQAVEHLNHGVNQWQPAAAASGTSALQTRLMISWLAGCPSAGPLLLFPAV